MDIYSHFSCYENLPVRIQDVVAQVLETKRVVSVEIFPIDIDPTQLLGFCWQFLNKPKNSINHHRHAWVCYSKHLSQDMARLVICKELLHLLDTDEAAARTQKEVSELIDQIVLPYEAKIALPALTDHNGVLRALAVMMPACAIEVFRPKIEGGTVSYETLSKLAKIPEPYVRLVFTPEWRKISDVLGFGTTATDEQPQLDLGDVKSVE